MGIFGTLTFFLHAFIGLTPIFSVQYGNDISFFLGLTTTNVFINTGDIHILRYAGFFDEPGTYALFALLAILINKVYFNDLKKENLIIFFTCFTFSIAFYISILVYLLFFYFKIQYLKYTIPLFFLCFIIFTQYKEQSDLIAKVYELTFERLLSTKDGITNTNRGDLFSKDLNTFLTNPLLGIGTNNDDIGGSNFFAIFARYGVIGSIIFYIHIIYFFLVSVLSRNILNIKCFIVLIMTLFYRPELSSVLTLLCIYTLTIFITKKSNTNSEYT
jgi:hypothetical protein